MLYLQLLCGGLLAATIQVQAAVKISGSALDKGDYVTCEVKPHADEDVSAVLEYFYAGEFIENSIDFAFDDEMVCGDENSVNAELICHDLNGKATCITTKKQSYFCILFGILCVGLPSKQVAMQHRSVRQALSMESMQLKDLERRAIDHTLDERADRNLCIGANNRCKNQYQLDSGSLFGNCPSDFKQEEFEIGGYAGRAVYCTKDCTPAEAKVCSNQACSNDEQTCEEIGNKKQCVKALYDCHGVSPIKMDESICNLKSLHAFGKFCQDNSLTGITYKDGKCAFIEEDYRRFLKSAQRVFLVEIFTSPNKGGLF